MAPGPGWKTRRCNFFNRIGRPRSPSQPCPRSSSSCKFAHPDEPEWDDAQHIRPPRYLDLPDTPEHSPPRDMGPAHRRRSRSRSPEPSRYRDDGWGPNKRRGPSRSPADRRGRSRSRDEQSYGRKHSSPSRPPRRDSPPFGSRRRPPSEDRMSVDNPAPVTSTNTTPLGKSRRPSTTGLAPTIDRAKTDVTTTSDPRRRDTTPKAPPPPEQPPPRLPPAPPPQQQPARRSSSGATAATPPRSTASIWTSTTPAPPIIASAPAMPPPTSAGISVFKQTPSIPVPPTLNPSLLASARSTTPVQPPPKEPPLEERQRLWEERTKTISARDTHRKTLQRLEQQIRELEALTSLRSGRPDVIQKLKALRVKRDEEQAAMNAAMKRLVESNSWPMGEASKSSKEVEKDRKNEEALRELLRLTETLNLRIAKADALVKDLGGQDQSSNSDDKMDVDDKQEGPSSRPLKRRRLSNDVSEPVAAPTLAPPVLPLAPPGPSMDGLQEMESALWRLEEQLQVIENDMAIQSHDFHEQVNSLLDPNNEEYAYLDQNSASAPSTTEAEPETSPPLAGKMQKMRAMQSTINEMDSEIRELGDEAAGLVTRYSELKEAITKAREDDKQYAADIVAIQDRLHALEKKRESDDEHIRTLEAAVNAYRESVLNSPPASPAPAPSFEHVLPLIEEKVIEIMQQAVREHGTTIRGTLEERLKEHDAKLFESVWDPLMTTARLIQVVASRVQLDPNVPP